MNRHKFLLVIFGVAIATGCKKSFLQLAPESNANALTFYASKADFELATNAAYSTLYSVYDPEGSVSYTGEMMGDNATIYFIAGNQTDKLAFRDYNIKTTNSLVYSFWQAYYKALYNINNVIAKNDASGLDAAYKESVKAQMLFLRGLYYFNMVRLWGDLPLVTTPVTVAETYAIARSPKDDVYKLVIADLKSALEKLPLSTAVSPVGRASKGAAQTALAEVYLTMGDKATATTYLMQVLNSNLYQLQPTYASLWGPGVKNTKESLFEIQYVGGVGSNSNNTYSRYYQVFYPNVNLSGFSGAGMNQVADDLYNEYEAGDPRRDVTIALGYQNGTVFQNQKYCKKWTDASASIVGNAPLSNNNFMVYRYADVLLMLTEATGDAKYLNMVRQRVGLPLYGTAAYPSATYATLDRAAEHERRVELAFEFHRWFDLKRTGRAVPLLTAKSKPATAEKLLLPIPEIVRTQNSIITQNAGY